MVDRVLKTLKVSERRACRVLEQARATQRHSSHLKNDDERLVARIIELATRYGRYGYRRITALLNQEGWKVNCKMSRAYLAKRRTQSAKETTKAGKALAH